MLKAPGKCLLHSALEVINIFLLLFFSVNKYRFNYTRVIESDGQLNDNFSRKKISSLGSGYDVI